MKPARVFAPQTSRHPYSFFIGWPFLYLNRYDVMLYVLWHDTIGSQLRAGDGGAVWSGAQHDFSVRALVGRDGKAGEASRVKRLMLVRGGVFLSPSARCASSLGAVLFISGTAGDAGV